MFYTCCESLYIALKPYAEPRGVAITVCTGNASQNPLSQINEINFRGCYYV